MAFSLGGKSGSKPGLEALIAAEKKTARGMDELARSASQAAREFVSFQQGLSHSIASSAKASADTSAPTVQGGKGGGGDSAAAADRIASAMKGAPVLALPQNLLKEFDRVGGTIVTLARRIDSAMKFPRFNAELGTLAGKLFDVGIGSIRTMALMVQGTVSAAVATARYNRALGVVVGTLGTLATVGASRFVGLIGGIAGAAGALVKLYQGIHAASTRLSSFGDVARRTFVELFHLGTLGIFRKMAAEATAAKGPISQVAGGVRNVGREILVALGVFGVVYKLTAAVKNFFVGGVKGASDLNETVNVTKETFGKFAGDVQAKANALSKYGFSKNEILNAANAYGALAQGAKMTEAQSAKLSQTYVQLAADAVSYKNVDLKTAAEKIQSGLSGESKPLKDWGVLINENMVKARAYSLQLFKGKGDISEYAKMMATASLISEQMRKANGDLAATSGSAANQFRAAGGGITNFSVMIGELLLPATQKAVVAFNELLASLVDTFETNKGMFESWGQSVSAAVDNASYGVRNFGSYWKVAQISATQALANVYTTLDVLPENFSRITAYVGSNWQALLVDMVGAAGSFFTNMLTNATAFGTALWDAVQGKGFNFQFTPLLEGFKATAEKFPDLVKPVWVDLSEEMGTELNKVAKREAARAKAGPAAVRPKGPALITDQDIPDTKKGKHEKLLADVAELGTKEGYSAIVKAQAQQAGAGDTRRIARNSDQQVAKLGSIEGTLEKLAKMGVPVFRGA